MNLLQSLAVLGLIELVLALGSWQHTRLIRAAHMAWDGAAAVMAGARAGKGCK